MYNDHCQEKDQAAGSGLVARMAEIFGPDGVLAAELPGFEARAGQLTMAEAVARALDPDPEQGEAARILSVEAGTGTGKTLAYLAPAALCGRKVVISTNTINLQEQILAKEIPFIRRYLAPWLKAMCVKGRQNYLCLYRWQQVRALPQPSLFEQDRDLAAIEEWLAKTVTGDRAELTWLADDSPLWASLTASGSQCLGSACPDLAACFLTKMRQQAARAHLLIVNHHLFFSDLAVRRFGHAEVLPRYECVIFDEAHHLENIATRHFGLLFSHYQALDLVKDIEQLAAGELRERDRNKTLQAARALAAEADRFAALFPKERGRFPLAPFIEECPGWERERSALADHFAALEEQLDHLTVAGEIWNAMLRRTQELAATAMAVTDPGRGEAIYWYERRDRTVSLAASPIEVANELRATLYEQVRAAVFTSATLTTAGNFSYFKGRLGLPEASESLTLDTPFDYAGRTLLYVPPDDFPAPAAPGYGEAARSQMAEIIRHSSGRALVLFTSISAMREAAGALAAELPYPVLVQGEAPRSVLLDRFRLQTHSVLLAVASFWEGVDVPGEALSCVIIDKLPFEVPSDPVIMARIEKIQAEGGKPFFDFQVPRAILMLRQGVGRLMRVGADRGVLAILDVRLFTKGYGRLFRRSLPPSPVSRDLTAVKRFFSEEG